MIGVIIISILILGLPTLILWSIGRALNPKYPRASGVFKVLAGVYLLVGLGICGSLITGFN